MWTQKYSETRIGKKEVVQQSLTRIEAYLMAISCPRYSRKLESRSGVPCQLRVLLVVGGETAALEANSAIDIWRPYLMR